MPYQFGPDLVSHFGNMIAFWSLLVLNAHSISIVSGFRLGYVRFRLGWVRLGYGRLDQNVQSPLHLPQDSHSYPIYILFFQMTQTSCCNTYFLNFSKSERKIMKNSYF